MPTVRLGLLSLPLAVGSAGLAWIVRTTGSQYERSTAIVLVFGSAALVALGLLAPPKLALVTAAVLLVVGTIAQNATVRKSMAALRA